MTIWGRKEGMLGYNLIKNLESYSREIKGCKLKNIIKAVVLTLNTRPDEKTKLALI